MQYKYKLSKYNIITANPENESQLIIFNSLNNSFSEISKAYYCNLLEKIKNVDYDINNNALIKKAMQCGVLVNCNEEEEKKVFLKYMSFVKNDILRIIIIPTMNCNFSCVYCYEDHKSFMMQQETVESIISFVKVHIQGYSILKISWFGGEPTLAINIIEEINKRCMEIARFYHVRFFSDMTTNGYLLDAVMCRRLLKCKVNDYQITIDGSEENHNKYRPHIIKNDSYATIIKNLREIKNVVKTTMITFIIRVNFTKELLVDFRKIIDELYEIFGDDDRFSFLFREVGDWGGESVKTMKESIVDDSLSLVKCIIDYEKRLKFRLQFTEFERSPLCYAASHSSFVINPSGDLLKCTVDLDKDYNKIGYIDKHGKAIFNNNLIEWNCAGSEAIKICNNCSLFANCFGVRCPKKCLVTGKNSFSICKGLNYRLQAFYKHNSMRFKVIKEDE